MTGLDEKSRKKPRWIFLDYEYIKTGDVGIKTKIIEIKFVPEDCRIKDKMMFTTTETAIKTALNFDGTARQCDSVDDLKDILPMLKEGKLR